MKDSKGQERLCPGGSACTRPQVSGKLLELSVPHLGYLSAGQSFQPRPEELLCTQGRVHTGTQPSAVTLWKSQRQAAPSPGTREVLHTRVTAAPGRLGPPHPGASQLVVSFPPEGPPAGTLRRRRQVISWGFLLLEAHLCEVFRALGTSLFLVIVF